MTNFDFHNLLFSTEFENFCRDLLEIREPNLKFTTYRRGKDGGIDIRSTNTRQKIIGQCKLYQPQNYNELLRALRKEVIKCKRQNPDRYLICTNIELSPSRAEEIKQLFGDFILNEEDIVDGIKLNKYLGQKEYEYLFKTYSKLLVPNLSSIELALEKIINRKYYNKTKTFLTDISTRHKLLHNTKQLPHLIQKLEENKVIVLSGNPGVGKTTTSMMIANYFISRKKCNVLYLEERDYPETLALAEENRLIIIDDFWGQNFSPSIHSHSTFQREFQSIIKFFIHSSNSYLILISRDYVIKDALANAELETKELLKHNKYIINIADFTFEDKLRIFLNHLLFYDYDLSYLSRTKYEDNIEHLLDHENYSPRHLDFFIKTYLQREESSSYKFYKSFRDYLDNPLSFWKEAFAKLNPTSKLILLVLLASSDPLSLEDLEATFNAIQTNARQTLNVEIIPLDFRKELVKLEEFYISIEQNDYYGNTFITFQSPGIKDYLLEYLRTDGYVWIQVFIPNALFFNQLIFIFSTNEDDKISDYDSDIHLHGIKIKLDSKLTFALKRKLFSDFSNLHFSNYEEKVLSDQLTRFNSKEDIKYLKILELKKLFDITMPQNEDVKIFIIKQVQEDFEKYQWGEKIASHRSMIYFPDVIESVHFYLTISANEIIQVYYKSITFANEYDYFYKFREIFPSEFGEFYKSNLKKLKTHIKELLYDDIAYYLEDESDRAETELDILTGVTIENLAKNYKIRITQKFVSELESTSGITFPFLLKEKKHKSKTRARKYLPPKEKYKPKSYERIIDEYLPIEDDVYNPLEFLKEHNYHSFIAKVKDDNSLLAKFRESRLLFEEICHFIANNNLRTEETDLYGLINSYFSQYSKMVGCHQQVLINLFHEVIKELQWSDEYSITKTKLNLLLNNFSLNRIKIEDLSPIIIPYKSWYRFSSDVFRKYFLAKHIYSSEDNNLFKEEIIELIDEPYDNLILEFLQSIDKKRLWNFYIIPELEKLIGAIDFSSDKTILLSFINFFNIEFDLSWHQKEKIFYSFSSTCTNSHLENILSFCKVEFYVDDFEKYFTEECQDKGTIERLNINTLAVKKINPLVRKTIRPESERYTVTDEAVKLFTIKLFEFLQSEQACQIMQEAGITKFVIQVIEQIRIIQAACKALS